MQFIISFSIILITVISLFSLVNKPILHKHFILEPANFKLVSVNQRPRDTQSIRLFKIGNVAKSASSKNTSSQETKIIYDNESPIIPSSFLASTETRVETVNTSTGRNVQTSAGQKYNHNEEVLTHVEQMLQGQNMVSESDLVRSAMREYETSSGKVDSKTNSACPICDKFTGKTSREELIAWNIWRSNLQNRIMELSDVDADYGTIFFFSFKVDENKNISNVKVVATTSSGREYIPAVRKAIFKTNHTDILTFPKGTKRKIVDFNGGFLMGAYEQYSSPSDYHDFERVRY
jgi:hypothetical protein